MALDKLLKRHFWAVILVLVAIAAFRHAQGITQTAGAILGPDEKQLAALPLAARLPVAPTATSPHATSADPILDRNAFDSVTGPLHGVPIPFPEAEDKLPEMTDPLSAPDCDGVRVLVIVASADPEWSFAALETQQEKGRTILRRR